MWPYDRSSYMQTNEEGWVCGCDGTARSVRIEED